MLRAVAALLAGLAVALGAPAGAGAQDGPAPEVLLFTKTAGFRHDAIPAAVAALQDRLGRAGLRSRATDDPTVFSDRRLRRYDAVVFLLTTGDVLAAPQEAALARFVRAGGGWAGVHSAADTEYAWSFYGVLLAGAWFRGHPPTQPATVVAEDRTHPSTAHLPRRWSRTDEWYAFRASPRPRARVLLSVDERSYAPGEAAMGADHPLAWCSRVGRGHAWYTALGHTAESYREPRFVDHLLDGIRSAAGLRSADCRPGAARRGTPQLSVARRRFEPGALAGRGLRVRVTSAFGARVELRARGRVVAVRAVPRGSRLVRLRGRVAGAAEVVATPRRAGRRAVLRVRAGR